MPRFLYSIYFLLFPAIVIGQTSPTFPVTKLDNYKLQFSLGLQLWGSYTIGQEIFNETNNEYEAVTDRLNFQLRRTRIALKGQAYPNLKFNFTAALDLVGRDVLAGTEAGANNGSSPQFRLWNAYVQWRILRHSEKLNIILGYLPPQIGRESITAALRSTSMEKSWSQNYLRRHLTGIGPGRAMGVNVGGLLINNKGKISLGYDLGIFNPAFESYGGNSVGNNYSPLLVGRLAVYLGDKESKSYSISHKVNYFGKRNGLTLAIAGATQGKTDLFLSNHALGVDFLFNRGKINVDGEWMLMQRKGQSEAAAFHRVFTVSSSTAYLRLGYNITLNKGYILEPVAMWVKFKGEMEELGQSDAAQVKSPSGSEQILDMGFNLYINPDVKLSIHYTMRNGNAGHKGIGATVNNYFSQAGVGAIHRGDWLGLGWVLIF